MKREKMAITGIVLVVVVVGFGVGASLILCVMMLFLFNVHFFVSVNSLFFLVPTALQ